MRYWLLKSEPDVFSVTDLERSRHRTSHWDGVRNYQARNMMRDEMRTGDQAFFYHSSCPEPGIVGIMRISREGYPDTSAFDPADPHFDPGSDPENPRWYMVDVTLERPLRRTISLAELRKQRVLQDMFLLRKGNRLSVMPVTPAQWKHILKME